MQDYRGVFPSCIFMLAFFYEDKVLVKTLVRALSIKKLINNLILRIDFLMP